MSTFWFLYPIWKWKLNCNKQIFVNFRVWSSPGCPVEVAAWQQLIHQLCKTLSRTIPPDQSCTHSPYLHWDTAVSGCTDSNVLYTQYATIHTRHCTSQTQKTSTYCTISAFNMWYFTYIHSVLIPSLTHNAANSMCAYTHEEMGSYWLLQVLVTTMLSTDQCSINPAE